VASSRVKKASEAPTKAPAKTRKTKSTPVPASALSLFLPYQIAWLQDRSQIKLWEKSRRIGGTWTQSYEDVRDCINKPGLSVWFSSADMTAASEYLDDCAKWVERLNAASRGIAEVTNGDLGGVEFADEDKDVLATTLRLLNGSRITILSSNPSAFRSKGGKVVWDEAAHHKNADKMWTAAEAVAMWGDDIRVISTHNGPNSIFARLAKKIRDKRMPHASGHCVTLVDAAHQGLVEKILKRPVTPAEIETWIQEEHDKCLTESQWQEEYMCNPQDEATALISYAAIDAQSRKGILRNLIECSGPLYVGYDVARNAHKSVVYVVEDGTPALTARKLLVMENMKFRLQRELLYEILRTKNVRRCCIDATGIGAQLAEEAAEDFGAYMVEGIQFSTQVNDSLATDLVREFDDHTIWLPSDLSEKDLALQKEAIHAVRKTTTIAGKPRYDAQANKNGHGDHFWALALAVHAARDGSTGPARVDSRTIPVSVPGFSGDFHTSLDRWSRL